MAGITETGLEARPMPARRGAWAIYEVLKTANDGQLFVGVTSDRQWSRFVEEFFLQELAAGECRSARRSFHRPAFVGDRRPVGRLHLPIRWLGGQKKSVCQPSRSNLIHAGTGGEKTTAASIGASTRERSSRRWAIPPQR